ncbi:RNA polymerase subunit sigma [Escherichia coli]|nr:RNA polymerase subunit sigma [Escherichia coli]
MPKSDREAPTAALRGSGKYKYALVIIVGGKQPLSFSVNG